MELSDVIATGDTRKSLEAIRDELARQLEVASSREVTPISRALVDVIARLDALPDAREGSDFDDLTARRAARRAQAANM